MKKQIKIIEKTKKVKIPDVDNVDNVSNVSNVSNVDNINDNVFIGKVWEFSYSGQKCVTIPKNCDIKTGEYVVIRKLDIPEVKDDDLLKLKR